MNEMDKTINKTYIYRKWRLKILKINHLFTKCQNLVRQKKYSTSIKKKVTFETSLILLNFKKGALIFSWGSPFFYLVFSLVF